MRFATRKLGKLNVPDDALVDIDHASLDGADFSGRKLVQFSAAGCRFTRCNFTNMTIESGAFGAGRDQSLYTDCQFDTSRIRFGPGGHARFVRCSFRDVDLREWFCFTVELVECSFTGVLRTVVFNGTVPVDERKSVGRTRNEFRSNDFSAAELVDVAFRTNIDLDAQRLPTDPHYLYVRDATESVALARQRVAAWPDERK